jgi:hypothetical protein
MNGAPPTMHSFKNWSNIITQTINFEEIYI